MDLKNAMNQLALLQIDLLREDGLNILSLEATQIPIDDDNEISISIVFKLNDPEMLATIVQHFAVFTALLDSVCKI
jgi:hypothetical protein